MHFLEWEIDIGIRLMSDLHSKLTESAYLLKKNNGKKEALIYLRKVPIYLRIPDHPPHPPIIPVPQ